MERLGVRELRQNLSKYLLEVKKGRASSYRAGQGGRAPYATERGREVARLTPSGPADSPIARLVAERGATMPRGNLLSHAAESNLPPAGGPPSLEVLDEMREERV